MFCYREQAAKVQDARQWGMRQRSADSALQDLLLYETMILSDAALQSGNCSDEVAERVIENLFSTVTNVNLTRKK